jgi:hypothetical protein
MLARLASDHELVFSPHFPYPGVGRIVAQGPAFAWSAQRPSAALPFARFSFAGTAFGLR